MRSLIVGTLLATLTVSPTVASGQAKAGSKAPEIDLPTLAGGARQ